jgi:hypothetical protein
MTGLAILIFLGETLLGTLLFVAIAGLIKFWAEHLEAAEAKPVVEQKPVVPQVVEVKV